MEKNINRSPIAPRRGSLERLVAKAILPGDIRRGFVAVLVCRGDEPQSCGRIRSTQYSVLSTQYKVLIEA
jgi:hypothetical protein